MKNLLIFTFLFFLSTEVYAQTPKRLFKDVSQDSIINKTIRAKYCGFGMDFLYCSGGYGDFGKLITYLMGEVPNSAIWVSYKNEEYSISCKRSCYDEIDNLNPEVDSIEIDITIYPFAGKGEDNAPFSVINDVRRIPNDSIPK